MKPLFKVKTHIALLLLAVFSITLTPLNLLHHHAEDEHAIATHTHEATHHCELDDYFCEPLVVNCEHQQHIAEQIGKCFSCEFHFIKQFTSTNTELVVKNISVDASYNCFWVKPLQHAVVLLNNKGPPVLG